MKTKLLNIVVSMLFFALIFSTTADALDFLDFEDLDPGINTLGPIPAGYQGFSWSVESRYITKDCYPGTGYEYGTIGRVSLFTGWAADISLSDGVFDFYGAYITSAWDSTEQVVVEGWRDGSLVHTETITTHNDHAYWFDFSFTNIDTLWFRPLGQQVVIDDITFIIIEVDIDIKPGSFPNSINPNAGGVIPVAVLTTDDFDASTVNPETVAIDGAGTREKGKSGKYGSLEDVDGDGDLDLVVQIENLIDWAEDATEATLRGLTWDGVPIAGTDSVNIVPPEQ